MFTVAFFAEEPAGSQSMPWAPRPRTILATQCSDTMGPAPPAYTGQSLTDARSPGHRFADRTVPPCGHARCTVARPLARSASCTRSTCDRCTLHGISRTSMVDAEARAGRCACRVSCHTPGALRNDHGALEGFFAEAPLKMAEFPSGSQLAARPVRPKRGTMGPAAS